MQNDGTLDRMDAGEKHGLSISAVSLMLEIPVPTIRSWERRYGIPSPSRTGGRHRRFSIESIGELRDLRDAIAAGRRAGEAAIAIRERARTHIEELDSVKRILDAALVYDPDAIRAALEDAHMLYGLDHVIQWVILPVLRDIGTLWEAGKCDVANEHLASQQIRAWLSKQVALARVDQRIGPLILACGPSDVHTIGLEAFFVILTRRGWSCRLLGAATPTASLVTAVGATKAAGVVVTSHLNVNRRAASESIRAVESMGSVVPFYAGNAFASARNRSRLPGVYLGDDLVVAAKTVDRTIRQGQPA